MIKNNINNLNNELSVESLKLVESFGIPEWMNHAPISNNWEKYNESKNNGELEDKKYKN